MKNTQDVNENNYKTKINGTNNVKSKDKEFIPRNSLLTDLTEQEHITVIYWTFVVAQLVLFVRYLLHEYANGEKLSFGANYIRQGFNHFENVIYFWIFMFCLTLLVFPLFHIWSNRVLHCSPKSSLLKLWNTIGILLICLYIYILIYIPIKYHAFTVAMASNGTILCEQVRLFMKTHAFLRHNCARILSYKPSTEEDVPKIKFSSFVYFLFAPTLVYRDEYPRTEKTNWHRVFVLCLEFIGCMFWASFMLKFIADIYVDFGLVKQTYLSLFINIVDVMLVAPLFWLTGFYILLHVWLNIWSEILTFADRRFYADWWHSENFEIYYRKWNLVVHNYLHTYIYKDLIYLTKNKVIATLGTFLISVLVHEYIVSFVTGFFMPILGIHFAISAAAVRIRNYKFLSVFLVFGCSLGTAIELSFYCMEYYARLNCPIEDSSYWKYFQFRMLTCNGLDL